jgi:hypothetical protein
MARSCGTCGKPLSDMEAGGDRCNNCWQVERGLAAYLQGGQKALDFAQAAMDERSRNLRLVHSVRHAEPRDAAEHAATLWLRLVTLWESAEEDELHDKLVTLMEEWKGEAAAGAAEMVQGHALWERFVTMWESHEEQHGPGASLMGGDEMFHAIGKLVDEWQGFAGKEPEGT